MAEIDPTISDAAFDAAAIPGSISFGDRRGNVLDAMQRRNAGEIVVADESEIRSLFDEVEPMFALRHFQHSVMRGDESFQVLDQHHVIEGQDLYFKLVRSYNNPDEIIFVIDEDDSQQIRTEDFRRLVLKRDGESYSIVRTIGGTETMNDQDDLVLMKQAVHSIAHQRQVAYDERRQAVQERMDNVRSASKHPVARWAMAGLSLMYAHLPYNLFTKATTDATTGPFPWPLPIEIIEDFANSPDHDARGFDRVEGSTDIAIGEFKVPIPLVVDQELSGVPRAYTGDVAGTVTGDCVSDGDSYYGYVSSNENGAAIEDLDARALLEDGDPDNDEGVEIYPNKTYNRSDPWCNNESKPGLYEVNFHEGVIRKQGDSYAMVVRGEFAGKTISISTADPLVAEGVTANFIDDNTLLLTSEDGLLPEDGSVFVHMAD